MRKVLITGGTRGIGRACVERFTESGDKVAFIYKSCNSAANELSDKKGAYPIKADVSNPSEIKRACAEALEYLGGIDILVNNAGISYTGLFTEMSDVRFKEVMDTNLSSAFYFSRELSPFMISAKHGRIINIGSVWGKYGASCEVAYSASKAGVRGLTMALARELGPSGITVNCVEPGVIETDMNNIFDEETRRSLAASSALCRNGKADEVAEAVFFLASEKASFITAQMLGVDGGFPLS